ncbi:MAG: DUF4294 domain-containing protein [Lewinella sp.]|nr:DUF4294 domain-containing protein [Lewinella sp.]
MALASAILPSAPLFAQSGYTKVDGKFYPYVLDDCGDTLIVAELSDVSISSPEAFASEDDYKQYRRYRRYAQLVYPYAVEAIRIFKETEFMTQKMRDGERKRYIKRLQKELKENFEDPLKNMSKTQGRVLYRMIERELDTPIYFLIKDLRGGLTARYWATMAGFYGHKLKEGYQEGDDPILDIVLKDFDISYELPKYFGQTPPPSTPKTVKDQK